VLPKSHVQHFPIGLISLFFGAALAFICVKSAIFSSGHFEFLIRISQFMKRLQSKEEQNAIE